MSHMKLSAEQAQRALDYLQRKGPHPVEPTTLSRDVSDELIERVLIRIAHSPDPRPGRVADAIGTLEARLPSSDEVAERMLWRALADSIR